MGVNEKEQLGGRLVRTSLDALASRPRIPRGTQGQQTLIARELTAALIDLYDVVCLMATEDGHVDRLEHWANEFKPRLEALERKR